MKLINSTRIAVLGCILTLAVSAQAQHYPAGEEGIKGGSLPEPGIYLKDYNLIYSGDFPTMHTVVQFPPGRTDHLTESSDTFTYIQAPRLMWMTDWKILGANYGMDIMVPFGYATGTDRQKDIIDLPGGRVISTESKIDREVFGLGDIQVEPLLLSWHLKHFDFSAGYAIWAPTGDFDDHHLSMGKGYWSHMITLGGVWYPDTKKTWAVSLLNRYEINQEQEQTHITPGNHNTLEWGLSKTVAHGVDVGFIGYYQQQTTADGGRGASSELAHVVGVGPEVSVFWKKIGLQTSLRYAYEVEAKNVPQGQLFSLTATKQF